MVTAPLRMGIERVIPVSRIDISDPSLEKRERNSVNLLIRECSRAVKPSAGNL